jgi:arylsulfatase A-like enzyme
VKRPNLILFNPDQWRGDVLGHLGNPAAVTPNLDRLVATDAVSFSNTFCQNPVCMPSRCSFMTGVYPHTWGKRSFTHCLHPERGEPNLLKELKDAGYHVWWSGKNDLIAGQVPEATAMSVSERFQPTDADYARHGYRKMPRYRENWRVSKDSDTFYSFYVGQYETDGQKIYSDRDWIDVFEACERIRNWDRPEPFCLFMALEMPHPDYGVEDPWFSMIDRDRLPLRPPNLSEGAPLAIRKMREMLNMEGWTEKRWRELRATYYGMCARVDHQFGLIVQALRDSGHYDDTALFCFSDHGDYTGDYGLVQKHFVGMEDALTRVPLVIKPPAGFPVQPGIDAGLTELIDMTETVYRFAGIDPAYRRFGRDLTPRLENRSQPGRDFVFCESGCTAGQPESHQLKMAEMIKQRDYWNEPCPYFPGNHTNPIEEPFPLHGKVAMIRNQRYKLVTRLYEDDSFFDLEKDPSELINCIHAPELQPVIQSFRETFTRWLWETDSTVPFECDARQSTAALPVAAYPDVTR